MKKLNYDAMILFMRCAGMKQGMDRPLKDCWKDISANKGSSAKGRLQSKSGRFIRVKSPDNYYI